MVKMNAILRKEVRRSDLSLRQYCDRHRLVGLGSVVRRRANERDPAVRDACPLLQKQAGVLHLHERESPLGVNQNVGSSVDQGRAARIGSGSAVGREELLILTCSMDVNVWLCVAQLVDS